MTLFARDFAPQKSKGGIFKSGSIQNFDEVMASMNSWLSENPNVKVLNVETVVLPNIHDKDEQGSQDTELWTGGESSSQWYQVFRVWYQE